MEINVNYLAESLKVWNTWVVIVIAAVAGIVGGLAHKLTSPPDDNTSLWVYAIVGGVASLAVLYVLSPPDGVKLIALSLAAGYAGKAVLDALEARVKTALAQKDAEQAKETAKKAIETGKEATGIVQNLSQRNDLLEKALEATGQPKNEILESFMGQIPGKVLDIMEEPTGSLTKKIEDLSKRLDFLGESLRK